MSLKRQVDVYQGIWEKNSVLVKEVSLNPAKSFIWDGRDWIDSNNPPFLAGKKFCLSSAKFLFRTALSLSIGSKLVRRILSI